MPRKLSLGRTGSKHKNKKPKLATEEAEEEVVVELLPRELNFTEDTIDEDLNEHYTFQTSADGVSGWSGEHGAISVEWRDRLASHRERRGRGWPQARPHPSRRDARPRRPPPPTGVTRDAPRRARRRRAASIARPRGWRGSRRIRSSGTARSRSSGRTCRIP